MIVNCRIYKFETSLLTNDSKKISFLFCLEKDSGESSWGEVSPLEGYSVETLDEAYLSLKKETDKIIGKTVDRSLDSLLSNDELAASVSFGLFGALIGFTPSENLSYPLSGLLFGSYEEILSQLSLIREQGFTHVKLKTSKLTVDQAKKIVDLLHTRVKLRIDVNAAWSKTQILEFLDSYPEDHFDYIEDPYPLEESLKNFAYPIGLDEILRKSFSEELFSLPKIKALVLKPTLMGVGPKMQKLLALGIEKGLTISLSSSFETGIGLSKIARLADFFKIPLHPMGLDTSRFLMTDSLLSRHTVLSGRMCFSSPLPDTKYLSEVANA